MKYFSFEISVFRYVFPLHNPVRSPAHAFLVLQSSSWVFCALAFPLTFCGAFQHVTLHCVFFFACPMHSLYKILCVPSCSTGEFLPVLPMYLLCSVIVLLPIISCVLKSDTSAYHHAFLYPDPPSPAEFFIRFTMRPLQASQRVRWCVFFGFTPSYVPCAVALGVHYTPSHTLRERL